MVDNLSDMLSTTRIVASASDHVSPPARSAVARFFGTPELVLAVLEHLHQDRIDLLVVAAVSKQLRAVALQVWIRHFDFDYKSFEGKLKLVQANSHLLAHIRCLRILSCNRWIHPGHHDSQRAPSLYWTKVESLFSLLSAHTSTYAQAPLLDIFINTADGEILRRTLQPYPGFLQRIAALRLLDSVPPYNSEGYHQDHHTFRTLGWTSLALLLDDVIYLEPTAVALRVLEYQCSWFSTESEDPDRTAKQAFWCGVTTVAHRSLQELHLLIDGTDPATYVLQYGAFASLKRFELLAIGDFENDRITSALIDTFLHRHTSLHQIFLEYRGSRRGHWPLVLDQTFPALHTLDLGIGVHPSHETTFDFLRRHPGIRQFLMCCDWQPHLPLRSLLSINVDMHKHLSGLGNTSRGELGDLIKSGARPLRAHVDVTESPTNGTSSSSDDSRFSDLGCKDWNGIRPEHVEDLTYLQVLWRNIAFPSLVSKSRQLFGDDLLPALTELCIRCNPCDPSALVDPLLFSDLFSQLTSATSLRILYIYAEASRHPEEKRIPAALLFRHVFPIRFELLCWRQSKQIRTTYFRFLPDDLEKERSIHPVAARMGKIGRLQAVPERTALTQVSKDGAWHDKRCTPWKILNMFNTPLIFLDHKGAATPMTR